VQSISLGFIIGGAIGNVIDRVNHQAVLDFIDFHLGSSHWPAFNAADSFITLGAVVLIVDSLFSPQKNDDNVNDNLRTR
jgi:signal peptidase II